jgi:RNA polymerase sigma-70 factor (sigma-E family)
MAAGLVAPVNPTAASGRVKVSMEHPVTAATGVTRLRWRSTEGHRAEGRHAEGLDTEFVAFARRRGPHHLRTAVLLTGDWHTAEDLVQTCLAKLYRVWHRLDTGVDPDSYLRRMLVNTQRSWRRARWRQEAPVEVVPDPAIEGDGQERHALADTVRRALAALPARQRAVLVLRYFEDLPEAQVADLLGCSVGTVKTHTSRGIRRLRELLGDELVPADPGGVNDLAGQRRESG